MDNPRGETQTGAVLSEGFLRNLSRRDIPGSGSLVFPETQAYELISEVFEVDEIAAI